MADARAIKADTTADTEDYPVQPVEDLARALADAFVDRPTGDYELVCMTYYQTHENHLVTLPETTLDTLQSELGPTVTAEHKSFEDLETLLRTKWADDHSPGQRRTLE
jgi:hypothetical protein